MVLHVQQSFSKGTSCFLSESMFTSFPGMGADPAPPSTSTHYSSIRLDGD